MGVADRRPVGVEVVEQRPGHVEAGQPQPPVGGAGGVGGEQLGPPAGREGQLGRRDARVAPRAVPGRSPGLDDPVAAGQLGRQVEPDRLVVGVDGVEGGRHDGRGVDHQHVAGHERVTQVGEPVVRHVARGPVADHQPDVRPVVGTQRPAGPGQLDRGARLAALRDGEPGQRRVHGPVIDRVDHRRDPVDDGRPGDGQGDGAHPGRADGTDGTSRRPRGHALAPAGAVGHVDEPHGATSASAGAGPAAPSGRTSTR
jgi:hypothetical protein